MSAAESSAAQASRLLGIVGAAWMTHAVAAAVDLGLPDLLLEGPQADATLAAAVSADRRALRRLLRALVTLDLCAERSDGRYEITPLGRLLAADSPGSLRAVAALWADRQQPLWHRLADSVRIGRGARTLLGGGGGFAHLEQDAEYAATFNEAMVALTRLAAPEIARAYDFAGKRVVDVGGGYGELLAAILEAHPTARGVLLDRPHAIAAAPRHFEARGLGERCELVAGDFFTSVPVGGDVYVLKSVIHDWDDDDALAILSACRAAMTADARLVLIERVMPERLAPTEEHRALARSDLNMLVMLGARERTEAELGGLLLGAGFRLTACHYLRSGLGLIAAAVQPNDGVSP